jgi:ligand-binding sensor domain-containing protein
VWNRADGNYLRQYTTGDGLPHPYVHAVWVDDDGTLWAATEGGLGRLDPQTQEWILYDTADGLDSDSVTALTRVGDVLIAGTQYSGREGGGLNLFDGQRWESASGFPSADHTDDSIQLGNNVNVILYDSATDAVWVGTTNGLGRYADQTWTRFSTAEGLPDNYIYSLIRGDDGALVVGTAVGAARFDEGAGGFIPVEQGPPYGVYGLAQDALGRYYFSGGGGIWRYDPANADWREFSSSTGDVPVYTTFGAARDADGVLYFGTEGAGLLRYDGNEFTTWSLENTPIQAAHAQIIPAPDGSLWFRGENSVDVDRFDLTSETWSFQPRQIGDSMPLAFDPQGNLWASEYQAGVWVIGNGAETHLGAESGLPSNDIRGVAFDAIDGHFLLATGDAGVIHLDADKNFVEVFNPETAGLLDNEMTALFTTADPPATWVGTRFGVSHLTPDFTWEHFPIGQPFTENLSFISRFVQGADGAIWVGTYGDWVYRYADGQWEHFAGGEAGVGLPSPYINSITLAPDGALWFATEEGAARFDGSAWTTLTMNDGLINNRVLDVYVDANGPIYFATAGGVTRWRP